MKKAPFSQLILEIHATGLAAAFAVIGGTTLSTMTAWLMIKGGTNVGAHLQLLSQYLWGYSVSWRGCVVGLFYGAPLGAIVGWSLAVVYNGVARRRIRHL